MLLTFKQPPGANAFAGFIINISLKIIIVNNVTTVNVFFIFFPLLVVMIDKRLEINFIQYNFSLKYHLLKTLSPLSTVSNSVEV